MTKGRNTFAGYQEGGQSTREELIETYLKYLDSTRVKTKFLTDLAKLVAGHLTQVQGEPCSHTTLLRNLRYKKLLLSYMARHEKAGLGEKPRRSLGLAPGVEVAVVSAELGTANLKRELDRLRIYTTNLESELEQAQSENRPVSIGHGQGTNSHKDDRIDAITLSFIQTCHALRALVAHLGVVTTLDVANKRILDASKRRNNVIVDADVAGPFFDWLSQQPDLGG